MCVVGSTQLMSNDAAGGAARVRLESTSGTTATSRVWLLARAGTGTGAWASAAIAKSPTAPLGKGTKTLLVKGSTATECAPMAVGTLATNVLVPASMMPRTGLSGAPVRPVVVHVFAAR